MIAAVTLLANKSGYYGTTGPAWRPTDSSSLSSFAHFLGRLSSRVSLVFVGGT
jgi:hypothetical protein